MAGEPIITIVGNLTGDPEMRFTSSGQALASFTVASTPRTQNRQTQQWEDGDAMFVRCTVWRDAAQNVADTLRKGMRVIVQGRLSVSNWETREGEKRQSLELQVDEIGPSLKYATAEVTKVSRGGSGGFGGNSGGYNNQGGGYNQGGYGQGFGGGNAPAQPSFNAPAGGSDADPWASPSGPVAGDGGEPPF